MSLIERVFGRSGPPATTAAPPAVPAPLATPFLDERTVAGLNAVWRCVNLIADVIADWPWQEWRGLERLEDSRLVQRPMALMTRREWTWRVVATEALESTCYLLHVGGTDSEGVPWSLLPIPPSAIIPGRTVDPWGLTPPTEYIIGSSRVSAEYVSVIRRSPWPGVPDHVAGVLHLAREQFQAYLAADTAMARYWRAGGPVQTVITTEQELDTTQADWIANRWASRRQLGADWPAVLGKGAKANPWGADPTSESAVEARREMVADIGRHFGVPTRILNAPAGDTQTYANVEDDAVDFERMTLRGYAGPIEDCVSELLPGGYLSGRRMRMDSSTFTSGNLESRSRSYPALVTAGILTREEARVRGFGLAPLPPAPDAVPASDAGGATVTVEA